jgi:ankyrin repeat protein
LKNGASNLKDIKGKTPLHLAVQNGHIEAVKELLKFPNHKNFRGGVSLYG